MASFKFLTEQDYDKTHKQYVIEVTVDLGDDDVRAYEQTVVLEPKTADEKGQEYADEMESELRKQKEANKPKDSEEE
jgi:hypothetical protein